MNALVELRLHAEALNTAVAQNKKFFAGIIHYVRRLNQLLVERPQELSQQELKVVARKIEDFFKEWRPSPGGSPDYVYIPPRQTADIDSTVRDMDGLVSQLVQLPENEFRKLA